MTKLSQLTLAVLSPALLCGMMAATPVALAQSPKQDPSEMFDLRLQYQEKLKRRRAAFGLDAETDKVKEPEVDCQKEGKTSKPTDKKGQPKR